MVPRIAITRSWSDIDVAKLTFEVCDGRSLFTNEAYAPLGWGATASAGLHAFGHSYHGGLFDLEAGSEGPEYASGSFRARFHYYTPNHLLISTMQQGEFFPFKKSEVAATATMFLRTEPALLDRFVTDLPALDRTDGTQVVLECVPLQYL